MHNPICPSIESRHGYATNQQLGVRTVGRFLLAVLTIRGFVSTRHTDNNIYAKMDLNKNSMLYQIVKIWSHVNATALYNRMHQLNEL